MKIENDKMSESAFDDFLFAAFTAADKTMKEGAAFYIWHADSNGYQFRQACKKAGWKLRQCIIWVKNSLVIGRQDYQWRHEPCLYGWKDGAGHYFASTRKETTVVEDQIDIDKLSKNEMKTLLREIYSEDGTPTTIIHEDKPTRSELHPTMKPVKLMARLIRNSSRDGEIVLDPFGGSGSTLIACEQMHRRCFTMELDPQYAQVIIDRWEQFTEEKAVRL